MEDFFGNQNSNLGVLCKSMAWLRREKALLSKSWFLLAIELKKVQLKTNAPGSIIHDGATPISPPKKTEQ